MDHVIVKSPCGCGPAPTRCGEAERERRGRETDRHTHARSTAEGGKGGGAYRSRDKTRARERQSGVSLLASVVRSIAITATQKKEAGDAENNRRDGQIAPHVCRARNAIAAARPFPTRRPVTSARDRRRLSPPPRRPLERQRRRGANASGGAEREKKRRQTRHASFAPEHTPKHARAHAPIDSDAALCVLERSLALPL